LRPVEAAAQQEQNMQNIRKQEFERKRQQMQDANALAKEKLNLVDRLRSVKGVSHEVRRQIADAESTQDLVDIVSDIAAWNELGAQHITPAHLALRAAQGDADALKAMRMR
jgi:uncharacterized membrane protein YccC